MKATPFFPTDLLLDLAMLITAQLSLSKLHIRRLLCAQLILSLSTLWALCTKDARWLHLPLLALCAAIATGEKRPARILEAMLAMFCTGALAAGFELLGTGLIGALAGCILLIFLLRRHRHFNFRWNVELTISKNGCACSVPALIDTGNRLREHASGLPVLIVEEDAVPEMAAQMRRLDASEIRRLPYGVLGSCGSVACFRPDWVEVIIPQTGARQAPPCYLAIFPGRIPGRTRALAPPEFAFAAQATTKLNFKILKRARRILYGVFKRKTVHLRHGRPISQRFRLLHRRQRSASASADP